MRWMTVLGIIAGSVLPLAAIGQAAVIVLPAEGEQLVEGHSTFTVIESARLVTTQEARFAAAVAFLIKETKTETSAMRFPGVLWFNDQYLTLPGGGVSTTPPTTRYPCGAVIAVNAGDPVPYDMVSGQPVVPADAVYVESYHIEPPITNDAGWDTDKWLWGGKPMWSVAVHGGFPDESRATTPDDGTSDCGVAADTHCNGNILPITDDTPQNNPVWHADPDFQDNESPLYVDHEGRRGCSGYADTTSFNPTSIFFAPSGPNSDYPCGGNGKPACEQIQFNALVFFFLEDLGINGTAKNHTDNSNDYNNDVSGCDSDSASWQCPADDDNREGNSHPFNPMRPGDPSGQYPFGGMAEGRNNHGGSADCTGDGTYDQYCHATKQIDIYFGHRQAMLPARNWAVYDNEGDTAPFHCHEDLSFCNEEDIYSGL